MKTLTPYLVFGGRCEAALLFYAEALGGRVRTMSRFGERVKDIDEEHAQWIMHAELEADGLVLRASDGCPQSPAPTPGGAIALTLTLDRLDEQERVWNMLVEGGSVMFELHEAFWGARFGVLIDKFGVAWQLSCDLGKG